MSTRGRPPFPRAHPVQLPGFPVIRLKLRKNEKLPPNSWYGIPLIFSGQAKLIWGDPFYSAVFVG